jgi:hypothetical protein
MEAEASCPYCGEPLSLWIDPSGGRAQSYVEDCAVCCRPIDVRVALDEGPGSGEDGWRIEARQGGE